MEAPGKVYLNGTPYYTEGIPFERDYHIEDVCIDAFIEKARTDAFIEKACSFFRQSHYLFNLDSMELYNFIEDFRKALKGE